MFFIFLLFFTTIESESMKEIPVIVTDSYHCQPVKSFSCPPYGQRYSYMLPSNVQLPKPWTLENPVLLTVTTPNDAVEVYVAWDNKANLTSRILVPSFTVRPLQGSLHLIV